MIITFTINYLIDQVVERRVRHGKFHFAIRNKVRDRLCMVPRHRLKIFKSYWLINLQPEENSYIFTINADFIPQKTHYKGLFVGYLRDTHNYHENEILLFSYKENRELMLKSILYVFGHIDANIKIFDIITYDKEKDEYLNNKIKHIIIDIYKKYRKRMLDKIYESRIILSIGTIPISYDPLDFEIDDVNMLSKYYSGIEKHYKDINILDAGIFFHKYYETQRRQVLFLGNSNEIIAIQGLPKRIRDKIKNKIVALYYLDDLYYVPIAMLGYHDEVLSHYNEREIFQQATEIIRQFYEKYRWRKIKTGDILFVRYRDDVNIYIFLYHERDNRIFARFLIRDNIVYTEDNLKPHYSFSNFFIEINKDNNMWWADIRDYNGDNYYKRLSMFYVYFLLKKFIETNYKNFVIKPILKSQPDYNYLVDLNHFISNSIFSDLVSKNATISINDLFLLIDYHGNNKIFYRNMLYEQTLNTAAIMLSVEKNSGDRKSVLIMGDYEDIVDLYKKVIENKNNNNALIKYKYYVKKVFQNEQENRLLSIDIHLFFLL